MVNAVYFAQEEVKNGIIRFYLQGSFFSQILKIVHNFALLKNFSQRLYIQGDAFDELNFILALVIKP